VKYAGAAAMYFVSKKLKKKYNITDERASLYDAANTWTEALNGRNFLGTLFIHTLKGTSYIEFVRLLH
jgi:microsomal prostaglandin-E synthase 2